MAGPYWKLNHGFSLPTGNVLSHEPATSCGWMANSVSPASVVVDLVPRAKSAMVMAITKKMCHHTLIWFSSATTRTPAMFRASSASSSTAIVTSAPFNAGPSAPTAGSPKKTVVFA